MLVRALVCLLQVIDEFMFAYSLCYISVSGYKLTNVKTIHEVSSQLGCCQGVNISIRADRHTDMHT